ncbi:hypothetical protein M885DRAFT_520251 [Pelagophyceae sp. CCMP2097]|nr:hypothetical protein M885DRAFT_520251 [Pelagophyceae sp. CCMP2097]
MNSARRKPTRRRPHVAPTHTGVDPRMLLELDRLRLENESLRTAGLRPPSPYGGGAAYGQRGGGHAESPEQSDDDGALSDGLGVEAELAMLRSNNSQLRMTVRQFQEDHYLSDAQAHRGGASSGRGAAPQRLWASPSSSCRSIVAPELHRSSSVYTKSDSWGSPAPMRASLSPRTPSTPGGGGGGLDALLASIPPLIREGGYLWKVPGHNMATLAKRRWFRIAVRPVKGGVDEVAVTWCDPRSSSRAGFGSPQEPKVRSFSLRNVVEMRVGHATPAWWTQASARKALPVEELCWSLVARDSKTLDVAAETAQEAELWKSALQGIVAALDAARQSAKQRRGSGASSDTGFPARAALSPEFGRAPRVSSGDDSRPSPRLAQQHAERLLRAVRDGRADDVAAVLALPDFAADTAIDAATGDTALLLACRLGDAALVSVALKCGARNDPHPTYGGTALQLAVAGGHAVAAAALLRAAAQSHADAAIANHVMLDDAGADGRGGGGAWGKGDTPLHVAARRCDAAMTQLLLEHHADVLARDARGRTAAHVAASGTKEGAYSVLALLLDAAQDDVLDARDHATGDTPLHVAARHGARQCAELLLQTAALATALNAAGHTPRDAAIHAGRYEVAHLVREYEGPAGGASGERVRVGHVAPPPPRHSVVDMGPPPQNLAPPPTRGELDARHAGDHSPTMPPRRYVESPKAGQAECFGDAEAAAAAAFASPHDGAAPRRYASDGGADRHIVAQYDDGRAPPLPSVDAPPQKRRGYTSDSSQGTRDGDWPASMTANVSRAQPAMDEVAQPYLRRADSMGSDDVPRESDELGGGHFYTPDGECWQELYSHEDEYTYYLHVVTGETQWDDPRAAVEEPPRAPEPVEADGRRAVSSSWDASAAVTPAAAATTQRAATTQSLDKPQFRRALSGGPLATAVDIFTVAGGTRAPSPMRPRSAMESPTADGRPAAVTPAAASGAAGFFRSAPDDAARGGDDGARAPQARAAPTGLSQSAWPPAREAVARVESQGWPGSRGEQGSSLSPADVDSSDDDASSDDASPPASVATDRSRRTAPGDADDSSPRPPRPPRRASQSPPPPKYGGYGADARHPTTPATGAGRRRDDGPTYLSPARVVNGHRRFVEDFPSTGAHRS